VIGAFKGKLTELRGSVSQWGLILLVLVVPLAISPANTNLYNVPKNFLSRILILLILLLWLSDWDEQSSIRLPISPLSLPILAFFLASLLSLPKALDFYQALDGAYRLFVYVLLYHLTLYAIRAHWQVERLFYAMGIAGGIVSIYGVLQYWGWDFLILSERFRPVSFLGNTGYAAEYLILVIPISLALFLGARSFRERALWGGLVGLLLLHLIITMARGPWVGLFVALLWMGWVLFRRFRREGKPFIPFGRRERVGVFLALAVFILYFTLYPGLLSRVWSIFDPMHPSNRVRLLIWSSSLRIIAREPLVGVGLNNYELHYPLFRTVEEWRLSKKLIVGEAHNDYIQIATETGLLGLALFLWLLFRVSRTIKNLLRKTEDGRSFLLSLGLGGGLTALLISAFFAFPLKNPAPALYFWLFLGLISAMEALSGQTPPRAILLPRVLAWGTAIPILAMSYVLVMGQFLADLHLEKSRRHLWQGRQSDALAEYQRAISFYFPNFYTQELRRKAFTDKGIYQKAIQEYQKALAQNPESAELHADLGATLGEMGQYKEAASELQKALKLNPNLYAARENLGHAYLFQGQWGEAVQEYQKGIELEPRSARAHLYLGIALYKKGEKGRAEMEWDRALALDPRLRGERGHLRILLEGLGH